MKIALASSLFLLSSVVSALPQSPRSILSRQAVTPDGTCGPASGYKCPADTAYGCCSQYGWCGNTVDHCGTGCQTGYGTCNGGTPPTTGTSTTTTPTTSSTTSSLVASLSTSTSTTASSVSTSSSQAPSSTTSSTTTPSATGTPPPTEPGARQRLGAVPYGVSISECAKPNTVAITFDDGPYIYTKTLLDYYDSQGVKATFFVNGQNWGPVITDSGKQDLIRRMIANGHQVASHTWSHADLSTLSLADAKKQMTDLESAFLTIMGKYPTYMRPPYLSCTSNCPQAMNELGYHIMMTNLDTQDWQYASPDTYWNSQNIFKQAVTPVGNNGKWLVLAHDVHQMTAENIARYLIKKSREIGLQMVTVGECMNDPKQYWYRNAAGQHVA